MKTRIKILTVGATIVALTAAATIDGVAQEKKPGNFAQRAQMQHPGGGGEAPWISIALRHKGELNLTNDQITNLEKIRSDFQTSATPIAQQLRTLESELRVGLQQSPANLVQARVKIEQGEKLRSELRYLRIEALENGKSVLTVQQRDQLQNLFAARHQGMTKPHRGQAS